MSTMIKGVVRHKRGVNPDFPYISIMEGGWYFLVHRPNATVFETDNPHKFLEELSEKRHIAIQDLDFELI